MKERGLFLVAAILAAIFIFAACRRRDPYGLNGMWESTWGDFYLEFRGNRISSPEYSGTFSLTDDGHIEIILEGEKRPWVASFSRTKNTIKFRGDRFYRLK